MTEFDWRIKIANVIIRSVKTDKRGVAILILNLKKAVKILIFLFKH